MDPGGGYYTVIPGVFAVSGEKGEAKTEQRINYHFFEAISDDLSLHILFTLD